MAPLMGLVMFLALLFGVFSVDLGLLYDARDAARTAADLATLAAVQEIPQDPARAREFAFEYAAQNGFDQCPGVGVPPVDFGAPGCDPAVTVSVLVGAEFDVQFPENSSGRCEVVLSGTRVWTPERCIMVTVQREWDWLFGRLLGLSSGPLVGQVGASGVACACADPRDVMVVLDRSGSMCFDVDGGVPVPPSGNGNNGCETASKSSLVGLDMTASGTLNVNTPVASLPSLNVPFSAVNPSGFTINGVPFTYNPATTSLNTIALMINGSAANVNASFATGNDSRLTLTSTIFGGGAQISIDDGAPGAPGGNFFFATRMLDANLVPTRLVGRDVGTGFNYSGPDDRAAPLADLNSLVANLDVDFVLVPGGSTFCIDGLDNDFDCETAPIPYNTNESLNTIITRINGAGVGVQASFVSDVFTLTRTSNGPFPISVADGPGGNFLQAMRLLQVPTFATAVGGDIAGCSDACFDGTDLPVPISTLNDELREDLVPVPTPHVVGSGEFRINGTTIPYADTDSLNDILARITSSAAGVTATIQTGTDQLVLTQKTAGDQPILFEDVLTNHGVGNFLQAMRFIAPVRRTTVQGLNVEQSGGDFSVANDLTVPLGQLDDELEVDFVNGAGRLCIRVFAGPCDDALPGNGAKIDYTAADVGGSTLSSILAAINNPANGTGVIAEIVGDRLTLTRNAYGAGPVIVDDITGNFFSAMRLLGGTKTIALGGIVGNLSGSNLNSNLNTLNTQMTVDFANVPNGSFSINDVVFTYNAGTDTINEIITAINASAAADVTASFDTTTDKFMLTRDAIGALPLEFSDLSGNFFQAMQFLAGGSATTAVGLDVGGGAGDIVASDLNLTLTSGTLAGKTAPDFLPVTNGRLRINGTDIAYNATTTTLNQVMTAINTSNAAVTASFDVATDQLKLTRNAPGATDITFADVTGNFFQVMRFVTGGGLTTAVGQDVDTTGTSFDDADLAVTLANLNDELDVDFVTPGSFTINGATINYTSSSTLNAIKTAIDGSAAGVTATYNTANDTLTLTNNAPGNTDITFSDVTGNFFRAMKFLTGSRTTAVSGALGGFNEGDLGDDLDTLQGELATDLDSQDPGSFTINGATITYDSSAGTNDSLNDVIADINASVGADVTATFDAATDRLIFTRDTYGDLPIDMQDVVGNFLRAFQMVTPPTYTTVVGLDVGDISSSEYADDDLSDLDSFDLSVLFLPVTNGSLTINGVTILYNAQTDELDDLVAYITNSAADVTASFDTNTDRLTLTRKTSGALDITYNDNVGNFFAAMQLLTPGTRTTAVGQDVGDFNDSGDVFDGLDNLTGEMSTDLVSTASGSFTINSATIFYDSSNNTNDSLDDVITRINNSVGADVTATFDIGTDRLTFTRDSYGPLLITMQDVVGNFLEAFRMVQPGTPSERAGGDIGSSFDPADLNLTLAQLNNNANVNLDIDFALVNPTQFSVNGVLIPSFDPNATTLNQIKGLIDASVGADVTATYDTTDGIDNITLTRDTTGALAIDVADVTGNFMQVMKLYQPGTYQRLVSQNISNCGGCTSFDAADLTDVLTNLSDELNIDILPVAATQFSINSVPIPAFNPATTTLNGVKALIDASGAGVTATYDTVNETMTLTRTTTGPAPITLVENNGNFLKAMRLLDPGTPSSREGGDIGVSFDGGDVNLTLAQMNNNANVTLDIDFTLTNPMQFSINGTLIPSFDPNATTLNQIKGLIDASVGADVTATFDTTDGVDNMTLTRDTPGPLTITVADVSGNFMQVMKLLSSSTRATAVGEDFTCGGCSTFDGGDLLDTLPNLDGELTVDFMRGAGTNPSVFTINAGQISYNPNTATLQSIIDAINASVGANVTATIDTGTDQLTLTSDTPGPGTITFSEQSGNFLHAMGFLSGGSAAWIQSADFANGTTFDASDFGVQLRDLADELQTDFFPLSNTTVRSVVINGEPISYIAASSGTGGDSLQSIVDNINSSSAGVIATLDATADAIRLTRSAVGPQPAITVVNGIAGSNFVDAMRMFAGGSSSGGGSAPTIDATVTPGSAGGVVIGTFTNGANGNGSIIGVQTSGASPAVLGAFTPGQLGTTLATVTVGVLGGGTLGTKTMGGAGGLIATVTLGMPESILATVNVGAAVTVLATTTLGGEPSLVATVTPGLEATVGTIDYGAVPPGVLQIVIATVTDGLDASDLLAELLLGDDPAVGHLIAAFTLSNHRPLDEPPYHFWEPFGPVQRAAGLYSRCPQLPGGPPPPCDPYAGPSTDFVPGVDQLGLASFSTNATLDLGLDDAADTVLLDQFGPPDSDFERALLGLVPSGSTNIGGGICMALNELRLPASAGGVAPFGHGRVGVDQVIVLLSDGEPNQTGGAGCPVVGTVAVAGCTDWGSAVPNGADEYSLYMACLAKLARVTIHTIGLGEGVNEELMIEIAAITGGRYFDADTSADLEAQFEAISNVLGSSLVR